MFNKKIEKQENKMKEMFHDVKVFLYGASISSGLVLGFVLGIWTNRR